MKDTLKVNLHQKLILTKALAMIVDFQVTIKDCPDIKTKNEGTKFKSKKAGKIAMVAAWVTVKALKVKLKMKE